jgi:hypothetical protein
MVMFLYWSLGIKTEPEIFGMILLIALIGNFVFCGQGFVVGLLVDDEDASKIVN